MEGDVITLQDLFLFDHGLGFDDQGRNLGVLRSTGLRPKFIDKLASAGVTLDLSAFSFERLGPVRSALAAAGSGLDAVASPRVALVAGLGALFLGITVMVAFALGAMTRSQRPEERMRRRLSLYTITGRQPKKVVPEPGLLRIDSGVARSAVELAGKVMERQGLDTAIDSRLEAAGLPLRTAEWMLLHTGGAVATAVLFLLLSGGALLATVLGLLLGLAAPWLFLDPAQGPPRGRGSCPNCRTLCNCSPAACRRATRCRRRWTPWSARANPRCPPSSTGHWSRAGSGSRSRTRWTASPTGMSSGTSPGW